MSLLLVVVIAQAAADHDGYGCTPTNQTYGQGDLRGSCDNCNLERAGEYLDAAGFELEAGGLDQGKRSAVSTHERSNLDETSGWSPARTSLGAG